MFTLVFSFALALVLSFLAGLFSLALVAMILTTLNRFTGTRDAYQWRDNAPNTDDAMAEIRWMMRLDEKRQDRRTRALHASDETCTTSARVCSTDCLPDWPSLTAAQRQEIALACTVNGWTQKQARRAILSTHGIRANRALTNLLASCYNARACQKLIQWQTRERYYHGTHHSRPCAAN